MQPRPDAGDDAVGALQNAAVLHLHVGTLAAVELGDTGGHVDDAEPAEDVGQFTLVAHDLEHAGQLGDRLGIAGRVAAHHDGAGAGVVLREPPDDLPGLGVAGAR